MRVSNRGMLNTYMSGMQKNLSEMQKLNNQMNTQKVINKVSDDPYNAVKVMNMQTEIKDIESISIKDIKLCFESFYRPSNEIIVIGGRFDRDKILEVIKNTYDELKFPNNKIVKNIVKHKSDVNNKKIVVKDNTGTGKTAINFKLDTLSLKPIDKLDTDLSPYPSSLIRSFSCLFNV